MGGHYCCALQWVAPPSMATADSRFVQYGEFCVPKPNICEKHSSSGPALASYTSKGRANLTINGRHRGQSTVYHMI